MEELEEKERNNEMMPWIKELVGRYAGDIQAKFQEILGHLSQVSLTLFLTDY